MTDVLLHGDYVYANWGRWVVGCSARWCDGAEQVYPGQDRARCGECGEAIGPLIWPNDPEGIETLLAMRPAAKLMNWHPGETLQDLLVENVQHGILPPIDTSRTQPLMTVSDDQRIIGGPVGLMLRSDTRRHAIEAGGQ